MEECSELHALVDKLLGKELPVSIELEEGGMGLKASFNSLETKKISSSCFKSNHDSPLVHPIAYSPYQPHWASQKVLLVFYFLYYFEEACYIRTYCLYENNFLCSSMWHFASVGMYTVNDIKTIRYACRKVQHML
jgi:hypothetical protein